MQTINISPLHGGHPHEPIDMPFDVLSGVPDVITHAKFHVNRLRGFSAATPPKVPFPILFRTTLATVLHYTVQTVIARQSVCLSSVCLSVVCCLSFVCNVFAPYSDDSNFRQCFYSFGTLAICDLSVKILRRSSQGNPSVRGVKPKRVAKYSDFGPFQGYISEMVQDRR